MARRPRKKDGVVEAFVRFDASRRKRQAAFWDEVFESPYGSVVQAFFVALFLILGLFVLFNTLEALSTGVIYARRSRTYLSEEPTWFWIAFAWNLALSALMVGGILLGLWFRFGTARGKRTAAQRGRRRARKKSSSSE